MRTACLSLLLVAATTVAALACPFCNPGESDVFSDVVDATAVVLVQKVDTRKYKVVQPLLGPIPAGRIVVAAEPQGTLGKKGHWLLTTAGPPNLPYWSDSPRVLNDAELAFAKQSLKKRGAKDAERWDFAAKHLENPSDEIASAAYNLLAAAPLKEVQKRSTLTGQARLLSWAKNPKVNPQRRALYLLMSYPGYSQSEAAWIEAELFHPQLSGSSPLIGPLATAYLHLKGKPGLQKVAQKFYAPKIPASGVTPFNQALTLAYEGSRDEGLQNAIRQLFVKEVGHPQRGAFVLAPLAIWGDTSAATEIESLFSKNKNVPWVKVAVIRYFRSFKGAQMNAALARLGKLDPSLVQRTTDPYRRADLGID